MGEKRERYSEAFKRIESSMSSGHFFEAITIQESIISDRVSSFLEGTGTLGANEIHRLSLSSLIKFWKVATVNPGCIWERCDSLISKVDSWRSERNKFIHGLVKFPAHKKDIPSTSDFIRGAAEAAEKGRELARQVSDWRARQITIKRKFNKRFKPE